MFGNDPYHYHVKQQKAAGLPAYAIRFEPARNGERVAVVETGGSRYWLASRYDPAKDAGEFAARLNIRDGDLLIIAGGGSRVTRAVVERREMFQVAYVEPIPEIWTDDHPADSRMRVFRTTREFFEWLDGVGVEYLQRYQFVAYPSLRAPFGDYMNGLAAETKARFEKRISDVQTLAAVGELVVTNILANLPAYSRMMPVRRLFSAAPSSAVLVAASGPSLDEAVSDIMALRDSLWIVAVDSAVLPLLDRGIEPDLAVCLDPREDVAAYIEPIDPAARSRVLWVVSAAIHPSVNRLLSDCRRYVFIGDHPLEAWLSSKAGDPGALQGGGSVILPAFDLAARLGASDIILAGADFSIGAGYRMHTAGAGNLRKAERSRFSPAETWSYQEAEIKAPKRLSEDNRVARSGENLLAYRRQLDDLLKAFPGKCRQLHPALRLENAESCLSLRNLHNLPIIVERDFHQVTQEPWMSGPLCRDIRGELKRRWETQLAQDPLFRTAVEARVFRRVRENREPAARIWEEEAAGLRREWSCLADNDWEAR